MAQPASIRDMVGGYSVTMLNIGAGKPATFRFTVPVSLYRGESVYVSSYPLPGGGTGYGRYTVAYGFGTDWVMQQPMVVSHSGAARVTDHSSSRSKGTDANLKVVPRGLHFLYRVVDGDAYVDTTAPIRGRHPYTLDPWAGTAWLANDADPYVATCALSPDLGSRIAAIDSGPAVVSR